MTKILMLLMGNMKFLQKIGYLLFFFVAQNAYAIEKDVGPWNMRGYVDYPRLGDGQLQPLQLQVVFDYDQINIPFMSTVQIKCVGYERNRSKCENNGTDGEWHLENEIGQRHPIWFANTTKIVKPYHPIKFATLDTIDLYECQGRISPPVQDDLDFGNWSQPTLIPVRNCSLVEPMPSLLVSHSMEDPKTAWSERYMIRTFDVQSANGQNETVDAEFTERWPLAYNGMGNHTTWFQPFCFDWIGHWQYRLTPTRTCVVKVDMVLTRSPIVLIDVDCRKNISIHDIACYSNRNRIYITTQYENSNQFSIKEYDLNTNRSRILVDSNSSIATCRFSVDHPKIVLDWQLYWKIGYRSEEDARIVFVAQGSIWTYSISHEKCQHFSTLADLGVINATEIIRFAMDWRYFYWIDRSSLLIKAYSFDYKNITNLSSVEVFDSEQRAMERNISRRITENVTYAMDMMTFSTPERPFPFPMECLIPDIKITVSMNSPTTAAVDMEKIWNRTSPICQRISEPPIQLLLGCQSLDSDVPHCMFIEYSRRTRNQKYSVETQNLVIGKRYMIIVNASFFDILDTFRPFNHTFLAETPDKALKISISVAVVALAILISSFFILRHYYKRRKYLKYIKAEDLEIINVLGEGSFGKVYGVLYTEKEIPKWWSRLFSIKRKKSINSKNRRDSETGFVSENLTKDLKNQKILAAAKILKKGHKSAMSFMHEMRLLGELFVNANRSSIRYIIQVYGICDHFNPYEFEKKIIDNRDVSDHLTTDPLVDYNDISPIKNTHALVLEFMNAGSVGDYLKRFSKSITNQDLLRIMNDVVHAFVFLSDQRVVHRDLAMRNVLVYVEETDRSQLTKKILKVKVADFGLAKKTDQEIDGMWIYEQKGYEQNVDFKLMAPETFRHQFSTHSDTWAFGLMIWEMYTRIYDKSKKPLDHIFKPNLHNDYAIVIENRSEIDSSQNRSDLINPNFVNPNEIDETGQEIDQSTNDTTNLISSSKNESENHQKPKSDWEKLQDYFEINKNNPNFEPLKSDGDPKAAPPEILSSIRRCLAYKPLERPTFIQLRKEIADLMRKAENESPQRLLYHSEEDPIVSAGNSGHESNENTDDTSLGGVTSQTDNSDPSVMLVNARKSALNGNWNYEGNSDKSVKNVYADVHYNADFTDSTADSSE